MRYHSCINGKVFQVAKEDFMEFKWLNESKIKTSGDQIEILAPPQSDFFYNNGSINEDGITPESLCNAPFYYTELTGDFVMKVQVSHDFKDTYDSASIMVMKDIKNWAKACFEKTDFNTHAAVSVISRNGECDDANGCNIEGKNAWLQICRCGDSFAFHYSTDGQQFYMMRFFNFAAGSTVKVGLSAHAPVGNGGIRTFSNLIIENKTVKNIREGI